MDAKKTNIEKMRNIAYLYLVAMSVQIVPIESLEGSWFKISLMAIAPILWLIYVPKYSKALIYGSLYFFTVIFCATLHSYIRISTLVFTVMYIGMFILYDGLIRERVFSIDDFIKLLRNLIFAYCVCLMLQQLCILIGIRVPLFNMISNDASFKLRSLGIEPSHSARIMGCAYYCYIYCIQKKKEKKINIKQLFSKEHRRVTLAFLWVMLTMGSGTAFVALAIVALSILRVRGAVYTIPLFIFVIIIMLASDIEGVKRVVLILEAFFSNESTEIVGADSSGAARIMPIFNTIQQFDLTSQSFLFGQGTPEKYDPTLWKDYLFTRKIGTIEQYGLISWLVQLMFVFRCMIRRVFSIETLLFVVLLGFELSSIAYAWAVMMMLSTVKYFDKIPKLKVV